METLRLKVKFKSLKTIWLEINMTETTEKLPISDFYKVIDSITVFKSEKWWEAIVVFESFGRRSIGLYLWQNRNGVWKRKHKFNIRSL
ncbi:hypothetical protein CW708_01520, partial [Candidatus Bathyarchaeota archaeon]